MEEEQNYKALYQTTLAQLEATKAEILQQDKVRKMQASWLLEKDKQIKALQKELKALKDKNEDTRS